MKSRFKVRRRNSWFTFQQRKSSGLGQGRPRTLPRLTESNWVHIESFKTSNSVHIQFIRKENFRNSGKARCNISPQNREKLREPCCNGHLPRFIKNVVNCHFLILTYGNGRRFACSKAWRCDFVAYGPSHNRVAGTLSGRMCRSFRVRNYVQWIGQLERARSPCAWHMGRRWLEFSYVICSMFRINL